MRKSNALLQMRSRKAVLFIRGKEAEAISKHLRHLICRARKATLHGGKC